MALRDLMVKSNRIEVGLFRTLVVPGLCAESSERGWQRIGNQPKSRWTAGCVSKNRNPRRLVCESSIGGSQRSWRTADIGFLLWREQENTCTKWIGNIFEPIAVPANLREVNGVS